MANLSRRERRLILGAGAGAVVIGAWLFAVEPALERNRATQEIIPARQEVLARRLALLGRKDAITAELGTVGGKIDTMAGRFFTATTPAVAASELQKLVKDMAGQARTEVRSERILPLSIAATSWRSPSTSRCPGRSGSSWICCRGWRRPPSSSACRT